MNYMKLIRVLMILFVMVCGAGNAVSAEEVMRNTGKGIHVVNTTSLCPDIQGFRGATPLLVTFRNGKVVKVEALPNSETPEYFAMVSAVLLDKWKGMTAQEALKTNVDMVSGASYSSYSVIENAKAGFSYYLKNIKK